MTINNATFSITDASADDLKWIAELLINRGYKFFFSQTDDSEPDPGVTFQKEFPIHWREYDEDFSPRLIGYANLEVSDDGEADLSLHIFNKDFVRDQLKDGVSKNFDAYQMLLLQGKDYTF